MTDSKKIQVRMRRLLALARRGEDGERENAERALARLLDKHGYTLADIDCDEMRIYEFTVTSDEEKNLLIQVICKALDRCEVMMRGKRRIKVPMTTGEHVEVSALFGVYRDEWRKESTRTLHAFINRNGIFPDSIEDFDRPSKVMTLEDLREQQRIAKRAKTMDRIQTDRMIEGSTPCPK